MALFFALVLLQGSTQLTSGLGVTFQWSLGARSAGATPTTASMEACKIVLDCPHCCLILPQAFPPAWTIIDLESWAQVGVINVKMCLTYILFIYSCCQKSLLATGTDCWWPVLSSIPRCLALSCRTRALKCLSLIKAYCVVLGKYAMLVSLSMCVYQRAP